MIYYIKTTPEVAKRYANLELRNALKDGNIALWMGDLDSVAGDTLAERAAYVGGALLTPKQCADEFYGKTDDFAYCYTPEYFGGKKSTDDAGGSLASNSAGSSDADKTGANGSGSSSEAVSSSNYSASAFTPSVDGAAMAGDNNTNENSDEPEKGSEEASTNKK